MSSGAVVSTFGPSTQAVEYAMQDSGMPWKESLYAWVDAEDKFNTLSSKASKLGAGEPPARTCGFSIDHSRFRRFGCFGTVNVFDKNLVARDDGSVAVASAPPPTVSSVVGDSGQRRVGKIRRIKSLPALYYCVLQRHRIRRAVGLRACPWQRKV